MVSEDEFFWKIVNVFFSLKWIKMDFSLKWIQKMFRIMKKYVCEEK